MLYGLNSYFWKQEASPSNPWVISLLKRTVKREAFYLLLLPQPSFVHQVGSFNFDNRKMVFDSYLLPQMPNHTKSILDYNVVIKNLRPEATYFVPAETGERRSIRIHPYRMSEFRLLRDCVDLEMAIVKKTPLRSNILQASPGSQKRISCWRLLHL